MAFKARRPISAFSRNQMYPLTIFAFFATAGAYIWPSPQLDALEAARFDQSGFNALPMALFVSPCDLFIFGNTGATGRSDAADWIRTAYHDMATYNITDGTGGLDASIRFGEEQARPENVGDGFNNTFSVLLGFSTRYISIADIIALGTIIAIENCGGPEIAFRGGRVDAGVPNAPGVPEPQQDLDSHMASFARQGFTQTEMIGLVACGSVILLSINQHIHTFGGVQHDPFFDIVGVLNDTHSTEDVAHFDITFVTFDNNVAKEYISGTTQNTLVVGFNDTTNSDKRIFASDGNATILSFANSLDLYTSTCADLFARMLDTVASGVELTDVITPLPVKPSNLQLILSGDTIQFAGEVRLWNISTSSLPTVSLVWDDHSGGTNNAAPAKFLGLSTAVAGSYTAAMRFLVDGVPEDQGGVGFAVQDGFMFSTTSCVSSRNSTTNLPDGGRVDVAVRNGVNITRVYLEE
ncbi:heme peroxidase [Mycena galericulata]|nr:heme peroxidase [Mycena galericulata]